MGVVVRIPKGFVYQANKFELYPFGGKKIWGILENKVTNKIIFII